MKKKSINSINTPLSEQSFITIFEQSPVSTQIFTPKGSTLRVNKAFEELWGVTFEQVKDYNVLRDKQLKKIGLLPYIKRGFEGEAVAIPAAKYVPNETLPNLSKVSYRYVSAIIYPVKDAMGKIREVVLMHQDITDQKNAEDEVQLQKEELQRSRDQLAVIFQGVADGITVQDGKGKLIFVNNAAAYATGYKTPDAMLRNPLAFLDRFTITDEVLKPISVYDLPGRRALTGEVDPEAVLRYVDKKTGDTRWSIVKARAIYNKKKEIQLVINIIHDITEQKITETYLKKSEESFRQLADSMPQQVWTAKPDGHLDYVNDQVTNYFKKSYEDILGNGWQEYVHPDDISLSIQRWKHAIKIATAYEVEFRLRRHDGEYFWHVARALPSFDEQKKIVKWFGTNTDITDRVEMEKRKDEFISMASHELKTPVTSLKLYTQLLERHIEHDTGNSLFDDSLMKMNEQINRLTLLISDLLDLSKITAGKLEFRDEVFDLDQLVRDTVSSMQAITPSHIITLRGSLGKKVRGDKERVNQVIINLLSNAIKYSPDSKKIAVHFIEDNGQLGVSVKDMGIGIPKEHQKRIFERFYQVATQKEKTYPGLGIGLYICNEIIKRHNGKMRVDSVIGNGSTFSFTIPSITK